jgi:hypothetical protein
VASNKERATFHLTPFLSEDFKPQALGLRASPPQVIRQQSTLNTNKIYTNPHQDALNSCYGARQALSGASRAIRRITAQHRGLQKMPNQHVGPYVWQSQQLRLKRFFVLQLRPHGFTFGQIGIFHLFRRAPLDPTCGP